jgi:hypothetical protein
LRGFAFVWEFENISFTLKTKVDMSKKDKGLTVSPNDAKPVLAAAKTLRVLVHLYSQSQPIAYADVKNAYTKDGMYCLCLTTGVVHKFPMVGIFRVTENYQKS